MEQKFKIGQFYYFFYNDGLTLHYGRLWNVYVVEGQNLGEGDKLAYSFKVFDDDGEFKSVATEVYEEQIGVTLDDLLDKYDYDYADEGNLYLGDEYFFIYNGVVRRGILTGMWLDYIGSKRMNTLKVICSLEYRDSSLDEFSDIPIEDVSKNPRKLLEKLVNWEKT